MASIIVRLAANASGCPRHDRGVTNFQVSDAVNCWNSMNLVPAIAFRYLAQDIFTDRCAKYLSSDKAPDAIMITGGVAA